MVRNQAKLRSDTWEISQRIDIAVIKVSNVEGESVSIVSYFSCLLKLYKRPDSTINSSLVTELR